MSSEHALTALPSTALSSVPKKFATRYAFQSSELALTKSALSSAFVKKRPAPTAFAFQFRFRKKFVLTSAKWFLQPSRPKSGFQLLFATHAAPATADAMPAVHPAATSGVTDF